MSRCECCRLVATGIPRPPRAAARAAAGDRGGAAGEAGGSSSSRKSQALLCASAAQAGERGEGGAWFCGWERVLGLGLTSSLVGRHGWYWRCCGMRRACRFIGRWTASCILEDRGRAKRVGSARPGWVALEAAGPRGAGAAAAAFVPHVFKRAFGSCLRAGEAWPFLTRGGAAQGPPGPSTACSRRESCNVRAANPRLLHSKQCSPSCARCPRALASTHPQKPRLHRLAPSLAAASGAADRCRHGLVLLFCCSCAGRR